MGGKGRRRREKNYLAANGGHSRLPPPPNPSQVDALPFKLRKIMSFTSHPEPGKPNKSIQEEKKNKKNKNQRGGDAEKKIPPEDAVTLETNGDEGDDGDPMPSPIKDDDDDDRDMVDGKDEKRKKKRKRKQVNDLRFEALTKTSQKKKERKKNYLEAKKKKHKKFKTQDTLDFPGREQVKFGDVVQAPPKLVALPKVLKNVPDASQERIRLKAIEAYRKRKGWTSRPGLQLPNVIATPSL